MCARREQSGRARAGFVTVVTVNTVFEFVGRLLASSLDTVLSGANPGALIALAGMAGALGLVAAIAAARMRSVVGLATSLRLGRRREHPAEPADRSELLRQSDPDADGRPRPRAPGVLLPTA